MTARRGVAVVAGLLLAGLALLAFGRSPHGPVGAARAESPPPKSVRGHDAWRRAIQRLRVPARGCFTATYPTVEWNKVACVTPPRLPYTPARGHRPFTVGKSNDFSAQSSGTINGAEGSFDSVSGVTSETGLVGSSGTTPVADAYSLQINTNRFKTSLCPSSNTTCRGWQQFVYSSSKAQIFIQYWLLQYNATCPSGWTTFQFPNSTDIYCYRNAPMGAAVAKQPITNLANLRLTASANTAGNDEVKMFVNSTTPTATAANVGSTLNLGSGWTDAEFIVVGDCCSHEATFNSGSTIVVRTTIHHGRKDAPSCVLEGFTGETNNLNLVDTAAIGTGPSPAIVSRQSNTLTGTAGCQAAKGFGDTHLSTFKGLLYDYQASGDFVLARTPGFEVQTRQQSGAPTWPNASVNKAVGARMGSARVAVCLPDRLVVNGHDRTVTPGNPLLLANGADVSRNGNSYLIRGPRGDSVVAQLFPTWIDASVGLSRSPSPVHGLLANANNKVNQVQARNGLVLTWPISFATLYGSYGDSWRVPAGQSILCGHKVAPSDPTAPFHAKNLEPVVAQRARAICRKKRVTNKALLDACTIDVAVTGRAAAANAYVGLPAPAAVGVTN
jgi:hypothetical protein